MGYGAPSASGIDRAKVDISDNPDFPLLFADPKAEGVRFFKKTGIFPPHHTTAIRESILDEHPWVAMSLMDAFEKAKKIAIERVRETPPTLLVFGPQYMREVREVMGDDPYVYGVHANKKAIDFIQQISVEQGLTKTKQPLNEVFPESVIMAEERL
jgi:4,5-dihydroxyphthalate decarboxylase